MPADPLTSDLPEPPLDPAAALGLLAPLAFADRPFDSRAHTERVLSALFAPAFGDAEDFALTEAGCWEDTSSDDAEPEPPAGAVVFAAAIPASLPESLERALTACLPAATQERLTRFAHPARRMQSLFGRLLAQRLANLASAAGESAYHLQEHPPEGPQLTDYSGQRAGRFAVAHTDGCAAVSLSRRPMGIDLEAPGRAARTGRLEGLADFAFGADFARTVKAAAALSAAHAEEAFLAAWGLLESAQKLNGEDRKSASASPFDDERLRKYARERDAEVFWDQGIHAQAPDGSAVPWKLVRTPGGLLTLLGGGSAGSPLSIEWLELSPETLLEELEGHRAVII